MKIPILIAAYCLCLIATRNSFAQQDTQASIISKNAVYVEFFGNAGYLYNITYDRTFISKNKNNFSAGLGLQYFPSSDLADDYILSFSPQANYFTDIKHHAEIGIGFAFDLNSRDLVIPLRIGYRYQKPEGGFLCKVAFTP